MGLGVFTTEQTGAAARYSKTQAPTNSHRRIADRFFQNLAAAIGTKPGDCFYGKNNQCDPDQTEGNQMCAAERFMVNEHAEQE